ncbi:hypothetical protein RSAG8_09379, partial [Rhizoctonia solani AG-8 WAC10335]
MQERSRATGRLRSVGIQLAPLPTSPNWADSVSRSMPSRRNLIHASTDPTEVVSIFHDQPCYYCLKCSAPLVRGMGAYFCTLLMGGILKERYCGREVEY